MNNIFLIRTNLVFIDIKLNLRLQVNIVHNFNISLNSSIGHFIDKSIQSE